MDNKNKWIIGVDLDGTLLRGFEFGEHKKVSPFTRKVLHEIDKKGHIVCIDTGRTFYAAKEVYESIGLDSIIINHAGAYIHNPNDDNFKDIKKYLNGGKLKELLNEDEYSDRIKSTFIDCYDVTHNYDPEGTITDMLKEMDIRLFPEETLPIDRVVNKALSANVVYDVSEYEIKDLIKHLEDKFDGVFHIVDWSWTGGKNPIFGIEINVKDASKGKSLLDLADMLDIPRENTMGIGDSDNDRDLMKTPEIGVAMKNASDEIKRLANLILDKTNEDEAVAHFLNEQFKLGL